MTELQKYESVNKCESLDELAKVIESFSDLQGMIQGREKRFNAKVMANNCINYTPYTHNTLTREFGIRQQAMYIIFYENGLN